MNFQSANIEIMMFSLVVLVFFALAVPFELLTPGSRTPAFFRCKSYLARYALTSIFTLLATLPLFGLFWIVLLIVLIS